MLGVPLAVGLLAGCATAVPLQQIAKIEYSHEDPILWRRNRDMAITVRSDVVDGVQAPDVTSPEAAAEGLRWGALAPESCPEPGRLDASPPGTRR